MPASTRSFNTNRYIENQGIVTNIDNYIWDDTGSYPQGVGMILYVANGVSCSCGSCLYLCCACCYPGSCFVPIAWFAGSCGFTGITTRCCFAAVPSLTNATACERLPSTSCWRPLMTLRGEMVGPVIRVK